MISSSVLRRSEERVGVEERCFTCGVFFVLYRNRSEREEFRFGACHECAAKKAKVEYPNIRVWGRH